MKQKTFWPALLVVGVGLSAASVQCAAQDTASTASPTSSAVKPDLLPSTVSPAIERFMQAEGRNLPTPPPLVVSAPRAATVTEPRGTASPTRAPSARPAAAAVPASPLALKLSPAPTEPSDLRFPINLATALRLSDARPLVVAAAQAGVWIAEAQLSRAKVLWVPTLMFGVDFLRHDGGGPDFNKGIRTAPTVNYFDAGTGLNLSINVTDAYFEPLIARQRLNAAHFDIQTSKNDAMQRTADTYFRVHQYRGMYSGALYSVTLGRELVEKIVALSKDLVPRVEVDRARNILADLEQRAVSSRQEWRVAGADLTQILRLDPRAMVVPMEHDHMQITLIDPGRSLDDLMPIALANRPELSSQRAQVQAAELGVRREKMRPALPIVMVGGFQTPGMYLQAGMFGLGPNSSLNQFRGREDVSLQVIWQLEGFGIGNLGRIKQQRGNQSRAIIELRHNQDMVAADVMRAVARVQSGAARVLQADRALRTGIIAFNGHLEGLGQTRRLGSVLVLSFRPQEAVYSLDLLSVAFNEYFTTVAEYNRAQFELFHALGYPAGEIARLRFPGEVKPVDTARPFYLPPVGAGPPPATR
jgi:outer membrane protein TolC